MTREVTGWLIFSEDDRKLNRDVTEGLIRAGVVSEQFLGEFDQHLAKLILASGAPSAKAATECGAHIAQHCVLVEPCVSPADVSATLDALAEAARRPGARMGMGSALVESVKTGRRRSDGDGERRGWASEPRPRRSSQRRWRTFRRVGARAGSSRHHIAATFRRNVQGTPPQRTVGAFHRHPRRTGRPSHCLDRRRGGRDGCRRVPPRSCPSSPSATPTCASLLALPADVGSSRGGRVGSWAARSSRGAAHRHAATRTLPSQSAPFQPETADYAGSRGR